jgi:dTDP-4-dehydrorhamnose reductase
MARVAITGAAGQLGRQLVTAYEAAGHEVHPLTRAQLDLDEPRDEAIARLTPDVVVNSAAWTDVDGCARDPARAMRLNGEAAGTVAEMAARCGALSVQISTNEVFDGSAERPYGTDDEPRPINAYGASKLAGERAVASVNPRHLIVRTAWLFGPGGANFVTKILAAARRAATEGEWLRLVDDEWGNPTWTPDLASAVVGLTDSFVDSKVVHAVGDPPTTRLGWAAEAFDAAALEIRVEPVPLATFERASTPPARAILARSEGVPPMDWRTATRAYVAELSQ